MICKLTIFFHFWLFPLQRQTQLTVLIKRLFFAAEMFEKNWKLLTNHFFQKLSFHYDKKCQPPIVVDCFLQFVHMSLFYLIFHFRLAAHFFLFGFNLNKSRMDSLKFLSVLFFLLLNVEGRLYFFGFTN